MTAVDAWRAFLPAPGEVFLTAAERADLSPQMVQWLEAKPGRVATFRRHLAEIREES